MDMRCAHSTHIHIYAPQNPYGARIGCFGSVKWISASLSTSIQIKIPAKYNKMVNIKGPAVNESIRTAAVIQYWVKSKFELNAYRTRPFTRSIAPGKQKRKKKRPKEKNKILCITILPWLGWAVSRVLILIIYIRARSVLHTHWVRTTLHQHQRDGRTTSGNVRVNEREQLEKGACKLLRDWTGTSMPSTVSTYVFK